MKPHLIITSFIIIGLSGCAKFIEVPVPSNALAGEAVFQSDKTAVAAINGLYTNLSEGTVVGGRSSVSYTAALLADELFLFSRASGNIRTIFENNMTANVNYGPWRFLYNYIENINNMLPAMSESKPLSPRLKKQLEGELKFLRAFCYFYLVTLYGDSPLLLTADWKTNAIAKRNPANEVWSQIIVDLNSAKELLSEEFLMADGMTSYDPGTAERVRPTKWAASSLLARVFLYNQQWANSEIEATQVIEQTPLFALEPDLSNVFLKNSKEAIWQIMATIPGQNTQDALSFILASNGYSSRTPAYLPVSLYEKFSAEDHRKNAWIGSVSVNGIDYHFPYKYKINEEGAPVTEYQMIFRLSEQYLIRAEALTKLGRLSEGLENLNIIRERAGLPDTLVNSAPELLNAIVHERRLELFTEWGHRWLDIKRLGIIDNIMKEITPIKSNGKEWRSFQQLMPISLQDITLNPNLAPNNSGY